MKRATKETLAGRRYLDLQREARRTDRPTDELIQLYALESFLDRLVHSEFADKFERLLQIPTISVPTMATH